MQSFVGMVGCCFVYLVWVGCAETRAAEQPKTPPLSIETKQPAKAPVAIPAAEIIPRSEQALKSLQETRARIAADAEAILNS
ncbi:MAG TPA: hypothetical protein VIH18_10590, partial [Candidatus Binatia bacterium]